MKKKLLIVDDSVFIWEEMKAMFEGTQYELIGWAKTGEDALEMLKTAAPDAVTMDIILPGMDGLEATRAIKKSRPEIKVLMVSSLAYDETLDEAYKAGADGFVFKPFDQKMLLDALYSLLCEKEA